MHSQVIGVEGSEKGEFQYAAYLHQAYKWFNYCNKNSVCVPNVQVLLIKAYKAFKQAVDVVGFSYVTNRFFFIF